MQLLSVVSKRMEAIFKAGGQGIKEGRGEEIAGLPWAQRLF